MMKGNYPKNWPDISKAIRDRAGNRCESCGVANHLRGARDRSGNFIEESRIDGMNSDEGYSLFDDYPRIFMIILTVGHKDQNPENNDPDNLACWCQRCHLNFDRPYNIPKRIATYKKQKIGIYCC